MHAYTPENLGGVLELPKSAQAMSQLFVILLQAEAALLQSEVVKLVALHGLCVNSAHIAAASGGRACCAAWTVCELST